MSIATFCARILARPQHRWQYSRDLIRSWGRQPAPLTACSLAPTAQSTQNKGLATNSNSSITSTAARPSRHEYASDPRVGVGVVMLRRVHEDAQAEVLLARRAKAPGIGSWAFPGGSQEIGETVQQCAVRETLEETGLHIRNEDTGNPDDQYFSADLRVPTCFCSANVIDYDDVGKIRYHYTIVEVAAVLSDPTQEPHADADIDDVRWVAVDSLRSMDKLARGCAKVAEQAVTTFNI
ncbi:hypothetical protein WJX73_008493 [Symbiochloris irregularis]|uniref:Nudix hydrolase domain-containing protein n=1 Tax=Symbiochloris irregularis TaxID=706552 RepID=A0AAW1P1X7_9CHLO